MADEEEKSPTEAEAPEESAPNISPAPSEIAEPDADTPTGPPPETGSGGPSLTAEPLTDGTIPTVLASGNSNKDTKRVGGRRSLGAVYRRADIFTTLLTFVATVVASALIVGGYFYITQNKKTVAPKVTTLDQGDLTKLSGFLTGGDTGVTSEVLTVSSSSLFRNRVAISSDLKVIGGLEVDGPTSLGDLVVNKTSTLGIVNIRGNLNVTGPTVLQGPALLNGGASISGSLSATGNGSFGGSISAGSLNVRDLSVSGNLNLSGHLVVTGQNPSASPASEAGPGATASVVGNDAAGTVTINTHTLTPTISTQGGLLVTVTFKTPYSKTPTVLITPVGSSSGNLPFYILKTSNGFTIGQNQNALSNTSYSFDYWVVQ
jgi:hypothetical protein